MEIYRNGYKKEYQYAYQKIGVMFSQFEHDLERFIVRGEGLKGSLEKIIAQYRIAQISANETQLCIFQNNVDFDMNMRGLFLSRECPQHTA